MPEMVGKFHNCPNGGKVWHESSFWESSKLWKFINDRLAYYNSMLVTKNGQRTWRQSKITLKSLTFKSKLNKALNGCIRKKYENLNCLKMKMFNLF